MQRQGKIAQLRGDLIHDRVVPQTRTGGESQEQLPAVRAIQHL